MQAIFLLHFVAYVVTCFGCNNFFIVLYNRWPDCLTFPMAKYNYGTTKLGHVPNSSLHVVLDKILSIKWIVKRSKYESRIRSCTHFKPGHFPTPSQHQCHIHFEGKNMTYKVHWKDRTRVHIRSITTSNFGGFRTPSQHDTAYTTCSLNILWVLGGPKKTKVR
jgi:hypothetical protein